VDKSGLVRFFVVLPPTSPLDRTEDGFVGAAVAKDLTAGAAYLG